VNAFQTFMISTSYHISNSLLKEEEVVKVKGAKVHFDWVENSL